MRSNASLSALFLLLAGCVGGGRYDFPAESAAPAAGPRDGYAASDPAYPAREPRDPYASPAPPVDDGYARPPMAPAPAPQPSYGASYSRPDPGYSPAPAPVQDYQDPTLNMTGPRGSSQAGANEQRYDEVGYAGVRGVAGGDANSGAAVAIARSVPIGSFLEVTSLDTGRTILVLVTGSMDAGADHPLDLSPGAARLLGAANSPIAVRARTITPSPYDQAALREGRAATERSDTPPVLLTALRKHLPGTPPASWQPPAPSYTPSAPSYTPSAPVATRPAPARSAPSTAGYYVQIAALSNAANAQALARSYGGFIQPGGGLYRVRMGPFRSAGEAESARSRAVQGGFGDAKVFTQN